jgi:hypothetical protein
MHSHDEPVASTSGSPFAGMQTVEGSTTSPEVLALESMRDAMARNFEQADLDVPAFLRKRGEM